MVSLLNKRLDYFILWKNGHDHLLDVLDIIDNDKFEIFNIKKIKIKNISKFLSLIYSHDYAPLFHLKGKLSYLKKINNDSIYLICVINYNSQEFLSDNNGYKHIESLSMNNIKKVIRNKFNSRDDKGKLSDNHVIHGTDNSNQAMYIFNYFNIVIPNYYTNNIWPIHLNQYSDFQIKQIDIKLLKARISQANKTKIVELENTPHFNFLVNNSNEYLEYLKNNIGVEIHRYHSIKKFLDIKQIIVDQKSIDPIIIDNENIILDGLHRATILKNLDKRTINVIQI